MCIVKGIGCTPNNTKMELPIIITDYNCVLLLVFYITTLYNNNNNMMNNNNALLTTIIIKTCEEKEEEGQTGANAGTLHRTVLTPPRPAFPNAADNSTLSWNYETFDCRNHSSFHATRVHRFC